MPLFLIIITLYRFFYYIFNLKVIKYILRSKLVLAYRKRRTALSLKFNLNEGQHKLFYKKGE